MAKIKFQEKREEMKILNELRLKLEKPLWALDPELALIDTILSENPRLYEIIAPDIMELNKSSGVGRRITPPFRENVAFIYNRVNGLMRDLIWMICQNGYVPAF